MTTVLITGLSTSGATKRRLIFRLVAPSSEALSSASVQLSFFFPTWTQSPCSGLASVAFFWNQFTVLHRKQGRDFYTEPALVDLRSGMADVMDSMAESVIHRTAFTTIKLPTFPRPRRLDMCLLVHYARLLYRIANS